MDKSNLQLEIIKKVLMLTTNKELQDMRLNVSDAISRECDQDDHDQELFEQWKKDQANV
tara:strand:- start:344 stop:520 length:177 start_codon:yes stop_codon:yes gene_type:complete